MSRLSIPKSKAKQRGAETVEFLITLLLFMFVFFMIIDMAVVVYNRGTVINASREGARQASLYWVDPLLFDPTTPQLNQRLKRSMVDSVMTWAETNLLIDPQSNGFTMALQINALDMLTAVEPVSTTDVVSVAIQYPHSYIGLTSFSGLDAPFISTSTALGVE
jgi:hypothetical protein